MYLSQPVWLDNKIICIIFGHMKRLKFARGILKIAKIIYKFCQIQNDPFQNGTSLLLLYQTSEISPNLVTLTLTEQKI